MNKTILMKYFLIALLIICFKIGVSQDFEYDMKRIVNNYSTTNKFSTTMLVKMYANVNSNAPVSQMKAYIAKKGETFLYTIDDVTVFVDKKYYLVQNSHIKEISINKRDNKKIPIDIDMSAFKIDSNFTKYDSVIYLGSEKDTRKYAFFSSKAPITKTTYVIDTLRNMINSVEYIYNKKFGNEYDKVEILYIDNMFDLKQEDESKMDIKYFIKIKNKRPFPSANFMSYKVVVVTENMDTDLL